MRKLYLFAAAAVLLTACVKTQNLDEVANTGADRTAVSFDVYTPRATKAGAPKEITTTTLQGADQGFGVFAYYTNNGKYDQYVNPNFMYNQKVEWKTDAWTYEPVKYWPNETGNAAVSDDKDYVTFFAYAPYVQSEVSTGAVVGDQQKNITGMINNTTLGDPKIKYVVDWNPATSVDLLWGVSKVDSLPFLNQLKPSISEKTTFTLMHALAKLNVKIDAHGDDITDTGKAIDGNTRIYVRSITFEGFAASGTLNLNNKAKGTPLWMDYAGIDNLVAEPVTIYDGRKDGKEGYLDGESTREPVIGLNPVIVQSVPYGSAELTAGVTNTMVNLFVPFSTGGGSEDPIFVIPNGEEMNVTIVYDVETKDDSLAGYLSDGITHGSTIENTITKGIPAPGSTTTGLVLEAGKAYKITLHLGMTTVKVDADVTVWGDGGNHWVDLPANS